jgi:hypothetical protein
MESYQLHTPDTAHWHALVTAAEARSACCLAASLENYLVNLLVRYARDGQLAVLSHRKGMLLEQGPENAAQLRELGDQCLLFAGMMPEQAHRWGLPLRHFVEAGRNAYRRLADTGVGAQFMELSDAFVSVMDVLQAMRELDQTPAQRDLLETYEQWRTTGSQRAFQLLCAESAASLPVLTGSRIRH